MPKRQTHRRCPMCRGVKLSTQSVYHPHAETIPILVVSCKKCGFKWIGADEAAIAA